LKQALFTKGGKKGNQERDLSQAMTLADSAGNHSTEQARYTQGRGRSSEVLSSSKSPPLAVTS